MFPRNPARIFRSRWSALLWAAGILFFAVTTIGFGDKETATVENATGITDATGAAVSNADLAVIANLIGG
ncbi:MAG: hypothetical protein EOP58_06840 [Sphingomonadales bacterium]|nr:MAG: hypothetical protein EOP58_06840 [Sphingomonadales bacterium]